MLLGQVCTGQVNPFEHALHSFLCNDTRYIVYASGDKVVVHADPNLYVQTLHTCAPNTLITAIISNSAKRQLAVAYDAFVELFELATDAQLWQSVTRLTVPFRIGCLDWNDQGLLLIAGDSLAVWHEQQGQWQEQWSVSLPNAIVQAQFSPNGMIATAGHADHLVTIWYPTKDAKYDFVFLSHPRQVANFAWKQLPAESRPHDATLFTMCLDGVGRFWSPTDLDQPHQLYLCAVIDPSQSLLTADSSTVTPSSSMDGLSDHARHRQHQFHHHQEEFSPIHYIGCDELRATLHVHQLRQQCAKQSLTLDQQLDKVKDLVRDTPDLLFRLQPDGSIIFWGVQHLNTWPRRIPRTFVMLRTNQAIAPLDRAFFLQRVHIMHDHAHIQSLSTVKPMELSLIGRNQHGELRCYGLNLIDFLDSTPFDPQLRLKYIWTGHQQPIANIHQSCTSRICTMGVDGQTNVWKYNVDKMSGQLMMQLLPDSSMHLSDAKFSIPIDNDRLLAVYDGRQVLVYAFDAHDCHVQHHVACPSFDNDAPLSSLHVRAVMTDDASNPAYILFGVSQASRCIYAWHIDTIQPADTSSNGQLPPCRILYRGQQVMPWPSDPDLVILNDRWAGSTAAMLLYDLAVTHSSVMALAVAIGPILYFYAIESELDDEKDIEWTQLYSLDTRLDKITQVRCMNNTIAIVSEDNGKHQLSIWMEIRTDIQASQVFAMEFDEPVHDMAWYMSSDAQIFLAVAFASKVAIYGQERASEVSNGMDNWILYTEVRMHDYDDSISGVAWVGNGVLVVTAGNQVRCYVKWLAHQGDDAIKTDVRDAFDATSVFDISYVANGALPLYHPRYLIYYLLWDKLDLINHILFAVYRALQIADDMDLGTGDVPVEIAPPYSLATVLELQKSAGKKAAHKQSYDALFDGEDVQTSDMDYDDPTRPLTEHEAQKCKDWLKDRQLVGLTSRDQTQLVAMIDTFVEISKQGESLDDNGARFTALMKNHFLLNQMLPEDQRKQDLSSRDIAYALHSESQDLLLEQCLAQCNGKLQWQDARSMGLFLWLQKADVVRDQMEAIARNTYLSKQEDKDPVNCTLFYLALRKKALLQSLWRTAHSHKEQRIMVSFLANDFTEQRWQRAAAKNAFVLLGKQRFEYAAAFFLLADKLQDCVNVILKQLQDYQLALAICRVYEGDHCPLIKDIIQNKMIPQGLANDDRWLMMVGYWLLEQPSEAVRSMIVPLGQVTEAAVTQNDEAAMVTDPTLFILYQHVKRMSAHRRPSLDDISPDLEYLFTLQVARSYERLGCPLLALYILTQYPPIKPRPSTPKQLQNGTMDLFATGDAADTSTPAPASSHRAADLFASDDDASATPESDIFAEMSKPSTSDRAADLFASDNDIFADMPKPTASNRAVDLFASDDDAPQAQDDIFADMAPVSSPPLDIDDDDEHDDLSDGAIVPETVGDKDLSSYKALLVIRMLQTVFHGLASNSHYAPFDATLRHQYLQNRQTLFELGEKLEIPEHLFSTLLMEKTIESDTFHLYMDMIDKDQVPSNVDVEQFLILFQLGCCQVFETVLAAKPLDIATLLFMERWILDMIKTFHTWNEAIRARLPHLFAKHQTFKLCIAAYICYILITTKQRHYEKSWVLLSHLSRFMDHIHEPDPTPVVVAVFAEIIKNESKMVDMDPEDFESVSDDSIFGFDLNEEQYKPKQGYQDVSTGAVVLEAATLNFVLGLLEFGMHQSQEDEEDDETLIDFVWTSLLDPVAYRAHTLEKDIDKQLGPDMNRSSVLRQFKTLRQKKYWHSLKTLVPVSDLLPFVHFMPPEVNVLPDDMHQLHSSTVYNAGTTIHAFCINNKSHSYASGDLFAVCTKNEIQEIDITKSQRFVAPLLRPGSSSSREWPHHDMPDSYPDTEEELDAMSSDVELDANGEHLAAPHPHMPGGHHGKPAAIRRGLHYQPSSSKSSAASTPVSGRLLQPDDRNKHPSNDNLHEFVKRSFGKEDVVRSPTGTSSVGSMVEHNERMITLKRPVAATCAETHPQYPLYITGCEVQGEGPSAMLWQFGQEREIASYYGCHGKVTRIHFDPYGQKFGACDTTGALCLWKFDAHVQSHRPYYTLSCHSKATRDFTFLNASSLLATAGTSAAMARRRDHLCIWDTLLPPASSLVCSLPGHDSGAYAVAYDGDHLLFSGGKRGEVVVSDMRQRSTMHTFTAHSTRIRSICVDKEKQTLITGSIDGELKIWDARTYKLQRSFDLQPRNRFLAPTFNRIPLKAFGVTQIQTMPESSFVYTSGPGGIIRCSM